MADTIKRLNLAANSFEANGNKYLVHDTITVKRYEQFEVLQLLLSWGVDFETLFKNVDGAYQDLNAARFMDAGLKLNNIREGIARQIEGRKHPAMLICTLFLNREGEDLAAWSETLALEKIADWEAEGIAIEDFFGFAFSLVRGFREGYEAALAATLAKGIPTRPSRKKSP